MAPMPPHAAVKETNEKLEKTQVLQKWLDENQYSRYHKLDNNYEYFIYIIAK
jgi:hypothetical protein